MAESTIHQGPQQPDPWAVKDPELSQFQGADTISGGNTALAGTTAQGPFQDVLLEGKQEEVPVQPIHVAHPALAVPAPAAKSSTAPGVAGVNVAQNKAVFNQEVLKSTGNVASATSAPAGGQNQSIQGYLAAIAVAIQNLKEQIQKDSASGASGDAQAAQVKLDVYQAQKDKLDQLKQQVADGQSQVDEHQNQLNAQQNQYDQKYGQGKDSHMPSFSLADLLDPFHSSYMDRLQLRREIDSTSDQIDDARDQINDANAQIRDIQNDLQTQRNQANTPTSDSNQALDQLTQDYEALLQLEQIRDKLLSGGAVNAGDKVVTSADQKHAISEAGRFGQTSV